MTRVYLSLNNNDLGYLIKSNNKFKFVAFEDAVEMAKQQTPLAMMMFKLNKTGTKLYDSIPAPFSRFLITRSRKDLIEKANLLEQDGQFEALYKLAGLDMMEINFKIHQ